MPCYGSIVVECAEDISKDAGFVSGTVTQIGCTSDEKSIKVGGTEISLCEIEKAWEEKLSVVFPPVSDAKKSDLPDFAKKEHESLEKARSALKNSSVKSAAKPRVIIPVFPGTNCEYDMARAFNLNGAETKILVFKNRTPDDLRESLDAFKSEIEKSQIIAFAGGFSSGDEPDGSGKYIANVIREKRISDAIMNLLKNRDGLVLGICNGFQALIKTGLVPFGEIREPSADMPTLTFNTVGRHISRVVRTRMVSATSPWALNESVLEASCHLVPVSHGEGRIIMDEALAKRLFENGQVFTQYVSVNDSGLVVPTMEEPDNPNGSMFAIEGLTSPDGHVLGKMGHSERTVGNAVNGGDENLIKNIASYPENRKSESSCQNLFRAGVEYFA